MPLASSGTISFSQVQTEFGGANPITPTENLLCDILVVGGGGGGVIMVAEVEEEMLYKGLTFH